MVQDETRPARLTAGQPHVDGHVVASWEFLVGPRHHQTLVLDEVEEIAGVGLVAEGKGAAFQRPALLPLQPLHPRGAPMGKAKSYTLYLQNFQKFENAQISLLNIPK